MSLEWAVILTATGPDDAPTASIASQLGSRVPNWREIGFASGRIEIVRCVAAGTGDAAETTARDHLRSLLGDRWSVRISGYTTTRAQYETNRWG